jgi:hypothetical protein
MLIRNTWLLTLFSCADNQDAVCTNVYKSRLVNFPKLKTKVAILTAIRLPQKVWGESSPERGWWRTTDELLSTSKPNFVDISTSSHSWRYVVASAAVAYSRIRARSRDRVRHVNSNSAPDAYWALSWCRATSGFTGSPVMNCLSSIRLFVRKSYPRQFRTMIVTSDEQRRSDSRRSTDAHAAYTRSRQIARVHLRSMHFIWFHRKTSR